jgi:hypothetical protein
MIHYPIPNNMTGLIIGKGGENLKRLMSKTGAFVHIPKAPEPGTMERKIQIKGTLAQIEEVKKEIAVLTSNCTSGGRTALQAQLLKEKQQAVSAIQMFLPSTCIV